MKNLQDCSIPSAQARPCLRWLRGLPKGLFAGLERARTRRLLAQLDDRQLADLGISHADRSNELDKPFWR
ncbi:hypothetical protein CRX42_13300 [Pseudomonas jessenii]|uniref:YjiS-like domain-containing protein n=1 Tax=Pseudomonas jessenii TaxID=77298 RepID=A0A2W0EQ40_PSEJE|nr:MULTISPECIES: DUF1127 domain-containing protein [Pseudomonas]PYY70056.1 hypothetical protein CRX42_13300 [Pseudomonas jessenii]WPN30282.1 DUF1127 domain-containing protein [Pseudomonas sp. P5_109]